MRKVASFLILLSLCAGCATRYDMKLTNGDIITSKGKPRLDSKQHVIFFTDASGRTNYIAEFRVQEIAPHKVMQHENQQQAQQFAPVTKK